MGQKFCINEIVCIYIIILNVWQEVALPDKIRHLQLKISTLLASLHSSTWSGISCWGNFEQASRSQHLPSQAFSGSGDPEIGPNVQACYKTHELTWSSGNLHKTYINEMSGYLRILRGFQDESHLSRDINGNNLNGNNLLFKTSQVK